MTPVDARKAPVALDTKDEPRRAEYRKAHQVRLVESVNEGSGVEQQPNGIYGFTYSPTAAAPIFSTRRYQNFEIHKTSQGAKFILGYITSAEAADIAKRTSTDVKLYPDAYEQSTELVCLDLSDVHPRSQNSGQPGSPAPLRFEP